MEEAPRTLVSLDEVAGQGYRDQCIKFRVRKSDHLPDIVREVQTEIESFHSMLEASVIAAQLQDVRISEGDQYLLYMRNLPGKVQEFSSVASECHDSAANDLSDSHWSSLP